MLNEYELIMMIKEGDDDLVRLLIDNNKKLINSVIKKYKSLLKNSGINIEEVYDEIPKVIKNVIEHYDDKKNISFKTYFKVAFENSIKVMIRLYCGNNNLLNEAVMTSHNYAKKGINVENLAVDNSSDPLLIINDKEINKELLKIAKKELSKIEYQVLMCRIEGLKDAEISKILNIDKIKIYNTVYRVRKKLKKVLEIPD